MMFWRNPEIRRTAAGYLALAVVMTAAVWFCMGQLLTGEPSLLCRRAQWLGAGFTGAAFLAGGILHFVSTGRRYRRIAELSEQLDSFLHGSGRLEFSGQSEGELSVLEDEIHKMTVMLRQQADALKGEKQYLCDAITDLSHQLRTPLTSLNLIQTMLAEPELDEVRRIELLRQLKMLLQRIDDLLVVLLKMARIDAGAVSFEAASVKIRQLALQALEPLAIPMELKQQQVLMKGNDQASFLGDMAWSTEALGNILKNCMEHTPQGGQIYVSWEENAICTQLRIEDTGPGIAKEDLPHILERFYKGKNQGEAGFGVGLAFARMVFAAQNGVLTAQNRAEGGACFIVRFYKSVV